jgi:hypothetical protein
MTDILDKVSECAQVPREKIEEILDLIFDNIGWDEINAYHAELRKGQDIREDAGGYMLRCIKRLFGSKVDPVTNYQQAAQALMKEALKVDFAPGAKP